MKIERRSLDLALQISKHFSLNDTDPLSIAYSIASIAKDSSKIISGSKNDELKVFGIENISNIDQLKKFIFEHCPDNSHNLRFNLGVRKYDREGKEIREKRVLKIHVEKNDTENIQPKASKKNNISKENSAYIALEARSPPIGFPQNYKQDSTLAHGVVKPQTATSISQNGTLQISHPTNRQDHARYLALSGSKTIPKKEEEDFTPKVDTYKIRASFSGMFIGLRKSANLRRSKALE